MPHAVTGLHVPPHVLAVRDKWLFLACPHGFLQDFPVFPSEFPVGKNLPFFSHGTVMETYKPVGVIPFLVLGEVVMLLVEPQKPLLQAMIRPTPMWVKCQSKRKLLAYITKLFHFLSFREE